MKKLILSLLIIAAFVVAPMSLFAQTGAGTTVSTVPASAKIVQTLTFTSSGASLNFGTMSTGASGGSCIITPNSTSGERSVSAGSTIDLVGNDFNTADFSISGNAGSVYTITLPTTDIPLSDGASHTMNVSNFKAFVNSTNTIATTGTLSDPGQVDNFKVGATITVGNSTANPSGTYNGSFPVTIAYN